MSFIDGFTKLSLQVSHMVIAAFFAIITFLSPTHFSHRAKKIVALTCSSPTILDLVVNIIYGLQRWRNEYLKAEVMDDI